MGEEDGIDLVEINIATDNRDCTGEEVDTTRIHEYAPSLVNNKILIGLNNAGRGFGVCPEPNKLVITVLVQYASVDIFLRDHQKPPLQLWHAVSPP